MKKSCDFENSIGKSSLSHLSLIVEDLNCFSIWYFSSSLISIAYKITNLVIRRSCSTIIVDLCEKKVKNRNKNMKQLWKWNRAINSYLIETSEWTHFHSIIHDIAIKSMSESLASHNCDINAICRDFTCWFS
jgi:hypothetical protein